MQKLLLSILFPSVAIILATSVSLAKDTWPQWRGPAQNGVAAGDRYPIEWSEESGIAWKMKLPGNGGSTPVVDQSVAFLTSGIDGKNVLLAVDLRDGAVLWDTPLGSDTGGKHRKGSGSNPSPVIDGDSVYAYFRSGDLACVDRNGKVRWHRNLQKLYGEDTLWWDLGSSPTLTAEAVVVAVMQSGPSYVVGLHKETGEELWKTDRMLDAPEEAAQSYSTPIAVSVDGKAAIAVMGADHLTFHDQNDGRELARLGGFNPAGDKFFRSIASPVAEGDVIVCPYARGATITAVRVNELAGGKGKAAIAWMRDDIGSDVPTPAADRGRVYVVGDKTARGNVSCLDITTGKTLWEVQLPKSRIGFSSSPLVAGNHLYVTSEDATTFVIGPLDDPEPRMVAENKVSDSEPFTVASPVPAGDSLLLRSRHVLYCIGRP